MDDVDGVTALPNPLPVPTKNGYTFAGWWNSLLCSILLVIQFITIILLYAKWTANSIYITYGMQMVVVQYLQILEG